MNKKTISLRGLKEVLSISELKNVLGGSGGGSAECCICDVHAKFCGGNNEQHSIYGGLFGGSAGTSCEDMVESWYKSANQWEEPLYCGLYISSCQSASYPPHCY